MGKALARFISKITKENLWIYVVNSLIQGPKTGYEIVKDIKGKYAINVTTVSVYVVLYKMERDGLVESFSKDGSKYYRITQYGLEEYRGAMRFLLEVLSRFNCTLKCGEGATAETP
ncbi:MAG: helix-turn-helix transcriptional regulator [Caldivirga sp.]|uniref:PadR family transcriptional regulator n=1 Tax=Caldivirga sp. MU80 TaxID=1650354 RepID=UPI0008303B17|nr:helix-turn-helix transcriptional regulator [Caldivirga sp. MU80]